jgi:hypothetical protein
MHHNMTPGPVRNVKVRKLIPAFSNLTITETGSEYRWTKSFQLSRITSIVHHLEESSQAPRQWPQLDVCHRFSVP